MALNCLQMVIWTHILWSSQNLYVFRFIAGKSCTGCTFMIFNMRVASDRDPTGWLALELWHLHSAASSGIYIYVVLHRFPASCRGP